MYNLEKTIKHFENLQKKYETQHNGQMYERVSDALEALYLLKRKDNLITIGEALEKVDKEFTSLT